MRFGNYKVRGVGWVLLFFLLGFSLTIKSDKKWSGGLIAAVVAACLFLRVKSTKKFEPPEGWRSRHIPMKVKMLAWNKFVDAFYADPANKGKHPHRRDYEFDHNIPFWKGGAATVENIRVIPKALNRRKAWKMPEDFRE